MADFTAPLRWDNKGSEPSESLKSAGFQGGYKPPAPVFNHIINRTSTCIDELQQAIGTVEKNATAVGKSLKGQTVSPTKGTSVTAGSGAEIFNDYRERKYSDVGSDPINGNVASGDYSHAEGLITTASGLWGAHAEGFETTAEGESSHAEGTKTKATGKYSHAEGDSTTASGNGSHTEGYRTTAEGNYAHAEGESNDADGYAAHAEGYVNQAKGFASHAEGRGTFADGEASHASGIFTTAHMGQFVAGKYNVEKTGISSYEDQSSEMSLFIIGYGTSSAGANAFRITAAGKCMGTSSFSGTGADFAEFFEWLDGNPNNEDRRGKFVTLDGEKIRFANAEDDYILGVISGAEAFVGNSASEDWQGRWLKDVFGERITKEVQIPEKIEEETGRVIPAHTAIQFVQNPDYNPKEEYISREFRKEWATVGLLGQVVVVDDGTCTVGGYCKPSTEGIGTAADSGYRVMKRIDENHIKVLVK